MPVSKMDTFKFYIMSRISQNVALDASFMKSLTLHGRRRIIKHTECIDSLDKEYRVRLRHLGHTFYECSVIKSKKGNQLNLIVDELVEDLECGLYDAEI